MQTTDTYKISFNTASGSSASNTLPYVNYKLEDGKQIKIWPCEISFRQKSGLSQHRVIHYSEKAYICEICQKAFKRQSNLNCHKKTHTDLKPYGCNLCMKAFNQKVNLRNHILTHTNERPYKCDMCEKGYIKKSSLISHKLKAHQPNRNNIGSSPDGGTE